MRNILLNRQQTAQLLGVAPGSLRRLADDPNTALGAGRKEGRFYYWPLAEVEAERRARHERSGARASYRPASDAELRALGVDLAAKPKAEAAAVTRAKAATAAAEQAKLSGLNGAAAPRTRAQATAAPRAAAKTAVGKSAGARTAIAKTAIAKPAISKTAVAKTAVAKPAVAKPSAVKAPVAKADARRAAARAAPTTRPAWPGIPQFGGAQFGPGVFASTPFMTFGSLMAMTLKAQTEMMAGMGRIAQAQMAFASAQFPAMAGAMANPFGAAAAFSTTAARAAAAPSAAARRAVPRQPSAARQPSALRRLSEDEARRLHVAVNVAAQR